MLIPSRSLLLLVLLLVTAAIAVSVWPVFVPAWFAAVATIALLAAFDAIGVLRTPTPAVRRILPGSVPLGLWRDVAIRVANRARRAIALEVHDHYPDGVKVHGQPQRITVPRDGWTELVYAVRTVQRGDLRFAPSELRVVSRLGLWQARRHAGEQMTMRVYPNFAALTRFALLATDHRLSQIGVLQRRRRGEGLDFHQLREYREGDSQRQIDWKATARTHKLVSREYQDERDQQVVLLIDCGRRMAAQDGTLAHFDHVLNAALLLAYVSLRQGDAVGLLTMSGASRWLAPRKSRATIDSILNSVYDLQPTLSTTDYYGAAVELMKRVRKRALVVVLTNMRDEDDDALGPALRLMQSRHLVLFASLRENILSRALVAPVDTFDRALTHAATADYLRSRELAFRKLERSGALCVDVEPEGLPIALVNRYLDIKRSGQL